MVIRYRTVNLILDLCPRLVDSNLLPVRALSCLLVWQAIMTSFPAFTQSIVRDT